MNLIYSLLLIITLSSCRLIQNDLVFKDIKYQPNLSNEYFTTTQYINNPLTTLEYDGLKDSSLYIVNSNIIVNNDSLRLMRFTEFTKRANDTLQLDIFETNPAYSQNLTIRMINNQFKMDINYQTSGPYNPRKIKTIKQVLILKNHPNTKNDSIFGTLNYRGICQSGCTGNIEIKGVFKAKIK